MALISKSKLLKLQKKFKTDAGIGAQYGITRQAIHQLRKKYGIDSLIAKNGERNRKIVDAYFRGVSGITLAEKHGLSVSQTYRIINDAQNGKTRATAPKTIAKKAAVKAASHTKTAKKAASRKPAPRRSPAKKSSSRKMAVKKK